MGTLRNFFHLHPCYQQKWPLSSVPLLNLWPRCPFRVRPTVQLPPPCAALSRRLPPTLCGMVLTVPSGSAHTPRVPPHLTSPASSPVTTAGTPLASPPIPRPSRPTVRLSLSTLVGPCLAFSASRPLSFWISSPVSSSASPC